MATTPVNTQQENPVLHLLKHIGHGIKVAVTAIGHGVASILGAGDSEKGKAVLKAMAQAAEDFAKTELGKLILQNVGQVLNLKNLTDEQKRQYVFDNTASQAKAIGIEYTNWLLNAGTELLVGVAKNYYAAVTEAPAVTPPETPTPEPPTAG